MPFIEVHQGGPDIDDGAYPVTLIRISDPKTVTAQRGPKAGQDIDLLDWTFAIDDGVERADNEITDSTSTASGPKSKMFAWLTALLGGKPPAIGQTFEKDALIGRVAVATIRKDENGWPRISNLSAMPTSQPVGAQFAAATGAPTNQPVAAPAPLRETVTAGGPTEF